MSKKVSKKAGLEKPAADDGTESGFVKKRVGGGYKYVRVQQPINNDNNKEAVLDNDEVLTSSAEKSEREEMEKTDKPEKLLKHEVGARSE